MKLKRKQSENGKTLYQFVTDNFASKYGSIEEDGFVHIEGFELEAFKGITSSDLPCKVDITNIDGPKNFSKLLFPQGLKGVPGDNLQGQIYIFFDYHQWPHVISLQFFISKLKDYLPKVVNLTKLICHDDDSGPTFDMFFDIEPDKDIYEAFSTISLHIEKEYFLFLDSVTREHDFIAANFQFPENLDTICGQYLFYFRKILDDLSIQINSFNLAVLNEKTQLFIEPQNMSDAVEKIQDLLALYLTIPYLSEKELSALNGSNLLAKTSTIDLKHQAERFQSGVSHIMTQQTKDLAFDGNVPEVNSSKQKASQNILIDSLQSLKIGAESKSRETFLKKIKARLKVFGLFEALIEIERDKK